MDERLNPFARFKPCFAQSSRLAAIPATSAVMHADGAIKSAESGGQAQEQAQTAADARDESLAQNAVSSATKQEKQQFSRRLKALAAVTAKNKTTPEEIYAMLKQAYTPEFAELLFLSPEAARILVSAASPAQLKTFYRTLLNFYCPGAPASALDLLGRALFQGITAGALIDAYRQLHSKEDEQYFLAALALTASVDGIAQLDLWGDEELKGEIAQLKEMTLDKLRVRRTMIGVAEVIAEQRQRYFLGKAQISRLRAAYARLRASMLGE